MTWRLAARILIADGLLLPTGLRRLSSPPRATWPLGNEARDEHVERYAFGYAAIGEMRVSGFRVASIELARRHTAAIRRRDGVVTGLDLGDGRL